ncbi:MAG: cytochrome ubiquinol oxidase subunit I [Deltaproteobacteria bacterium]|nr:cytochrome ubiquinol oxidase subunit I [Deltaproteobacteria bacterium]
MRTKETLQKIYEGHRTLTAVLSLFIALSVVGIKALHAEDMSPESPEPVESKYLDEEKERWKGGPAFFESVEGVERIPVPSVADWKEKKVVSLPQGAVEFPELSSDPKNPNVDMISKEAWNIPYARFSYFGLSNRDIAWIMGQLHILFASFILGVPFFIIIAEILGWRSGDKKYERLAKETTKIVVVCYSLTALTGGFFLLVLITFYPSFMTWLFRGFKNLVSFWYPVLFIIETIFMYCYYYMWEPLDKMNKKWVHIILGILLNLSGIALLILINAPASFMLTPPTVGGSVQGIAGFGEWAWINNFSWWPLNLHRLLGNFTYGGFIVAFIGAYMYLMSKNDEERAYYDWQGYLGNTIGLGFIFPLPAVGYIYAHELYQYDASIGMYIMSDRLSMFMLVQAVLIGLLFIGSNYYIWVSTKRIEGAQKYLLGMKYTYILMFVCAAIWFAPRHFFATMLLEPGMVPAAMIKDAYLAATELPEELAFIALMKAKNTAATVLIFLTLLNFILYRIAVKKGTIEYGKINPVSQFTLIFLAFSSTWLMGLMGAIRELARKNYHVYRVFKDMTPDAYTPTLQHTGMVVTSVTLIFFAILCFIIWMQLKLPKSASAEKKNSGEG